MNNSMPTLNNVFAVTKETPHKHESANWNTFRVRLSKEIKGVKWTASVSDIDLKMAELLDIKIPAIFKSCWKKSEKLKKIIDESVKAPEDKFELELTEHTITSEHHPFIEVRFKNALLYKIEFDINLLFKIKGFILKIQKGEIIEIYSGTCEAEGNIKWEGIKLLEKKFEPLTLPKLIAF